VNADQKLCNRKKLLWPLAAIIIGAVISMNPFYAPPLSFKFGVTAWFADLVVVLICLARPVAARLGVLAAGVFFAVPCFLSAPPLFRGVLMCTMAFPFAIVSASLFAPPTAGYRTRLAYFFTWMGTQKIQHRPHSFAVAPLLHLIAATIIFAAALACVKVVSPLGLWLLVRWLAGGIMIFSFAEMATASHDFLTALMGLTAPALMRSPFLSTSVGEFWTRRWNVAASRLGFRPLAFTPLARHGVVLALFAAFFASALGHVLLAYMAMMRWKLSLLCGAFFLIQPLLILAERRMNVRRWPAAAARVWTLTALAITSPLFVEPGIRLIAPSWGASDNLLTPTIFTLGFAIGVNLFFSLGQFVSCPRSSLRYQT
jgi:alginate O-acetyltransferase complex protein AlgI